MGNHEECAIIEQDHGGHCGVIRIAIEKHTKGDRSHGGQREGEKTSSRGVKTATPPAAIPPMTKARKRVLLGRYRRLQDRGRERLCLTIVRGCRVSQTGRRELTACR